MSNETCTVTIADIYGAEWWDRNKAELDREWEWGFGVAASREERVLIGNEGIEVSRVLGCNSPRIILHRRKPEPPTIESTYGTATPKIPAGWVSTGEFTGRFEIGESWLGIPANEEPYAITATFPYVDEKDKPRLKIRRLTLTLREVYGVDEVKIPVGWEWTGEWRVPMDHEWQLGRTGCVCINVDLTHPRLILRERPKKVWFKAEEEVRPPLIGDHFWRGEEWQTASEDFKTPYLCATRHEEVDDTTQIVTQEDIDACGR